MSSHIASARLADTDADYERLGILRGQPQPHEDGIRTDGDKGSFEWWYTDAEFDDHTQVVLIFYTKNYFDVPGPARPTADIVVTYPDGSKKRGAVQLPEGTKITAATDHCDVTIGNCAIRRDDDGTYVLDYQDERITYHAVMTSTLPMFRPSTGHWFFGDEDENVLGWLAAQPATTVKATLTVDGETKELTGAGYHDHNWGNVAMNDIMNHWYWARATVGDYHTICVDIIAEKKYGYKRLPAFMLAKGEAIISDDQSLTQVSREDTVLHPTTGKFMDNHLIFRQPLSPEESYTVEWIRKRDLGTDNLLDTLSAPVKLMAKLAGANPTYTRIIGDVKLTHTVGDHSEVVEQGGLWEQMFFGNNKTAIIDGKEVESLHQLKQDTKEHEEAR